MLTKPDGFGVGDNKKLHKPELLKPDSNLKSCLSPKFGLKQLVH